MLACVSFLRFCPWKLAPPSSSPLPSLGRKLFCEAQASISVPSTEKCSSDNSGLTWMVQSLVMNLANTSPFCSRSRFFVNTVGSHTGSSGESPTNQWYKDSGVLTAPCGGADNSSDVDRFGEIGSHIWSTIYLAIPGGRFGGV